MRENVVDRAPQLFTSATGEWLTPTPILRAATAVMNGIDCDPAAEPGDRHNVPAKVYYTERENGLEQPWKGRVFLNAPNSLSKTMGKSALLPWAEKLAREIAAGRTTQAIVLTRSATDTRAFHHFALRANVYCFVQRRLRFSGEKRDAPFPSVIFYYGRNVRGFSNAFARYGLIGAAIMQCEKDGQSSLAAYDTV